MGREETRSPSHLMGRASTSDQIIINNWVWGGPCHLHPQQLHPPCGGGVSSQPEKENHCMTVELIAFLPD